MSAPPANEMASVIAKPIQNDSSQPSGSEMSQKAMYVENIAISPCAKLITPVARWMSTSASASTA